MQKITTTQQSLDYIAAVQTPIQWRESGSKSDPARFWRNSGLDALILGSPEHSGRSEEVAREVYHRLVARFVGTQAFKQQRRVLQTGILLSLGGAIVASLGLVGAASPIPLPFVPSWLPGLAYLGTPIALLAYASFVWNSAPDWMCSPAQLEQYKQEARGAVQRCFLRTMPRTTAADGREVPEDLADVWRHGWLTSEGRPISSEIVDTDATSLVAIETARGWRSVFLTLVSLSLMGLCMPCFVFLFAPIMLLLSARSGTNPGVLRAMELDRRQGVEGPLLVAAGGIDWAEHQEQARMQQIVEARNDATPILRLGEATGILAGRGDLYAPSVGLPFDLSLRDLQNHLLVLGGTGSGKTSGVLRPLAYQVAGLPNVGLVVMDGKAALPAELRNLPGMKIVDPAASKFSLVAGLSPTELIDTIADVLRPPGESDPYWSDSAMGLLRRAAVVARHAGGDWWTLQGVMRIAASDEELVKAKGTFPIERLLEDPLLEEALLYFAYEWRNMDAKPKSGILSHARAWISTITAHPELLAWAGTLEGEDSFDLLEATRGGRLGFLIPAHRYGRAGAAVTALLKARLYSSLKGRAERALLPEETPVVFLIDEAQEVATRDDATMLSIGRSLGLAMVGATQTVEGVKEKLGEHPAAKWLAVYGNVVALSGRSTATDAFVAERAGASWKANVSGVPGIPVKDAITSSIFSGSVAVARRQATMREFATPPPSPIAPFVQQAQNAQSKGQAASPDARMNREFDTGITSALRPFPLVFPEEMTTLLAEPNLALAVTTRARVPRRDVIKLSPRF